jgi:hypothetical protein
MKTLTFLRVNLLLMLCLFLHPAFAALGGGSITGQVTDPETKEPVAFATVILESQGTQHEYTTNEHGYYYASNIMPGIYSITVAFMSKRATTPDVKLSSDEQLALNFELGVAQAIGPVDIVATKGRKPLIDPLDPTNALLDRDDIKKMPITNISQVTEQQTGVVQVNGETYVHGARAGSVSYYIDGCLIMGSPDIPLCGLDTYRSYTGFIPPKYGDTTGGVIVMETRNYFSEAH